MAGQGGAAIGLSRCEHVIHNSSDLSETPIAQRRKDCSSATAGRHAIVRMWKEFIFLELHAE